MEILDVMTANRDKVVWAAAQGKDVQVDDTNTPPFIPVDDEQARHRARRQAPVPRAARKPSRR